MSSLLGKVIGKAGSVVAAPLRPVLAFTNDVPVRLAAFLVFGTLVIYPPFRPKTTNTFKSEYDYIVVGGGSAGSVVASRLSEDPCVNVLLLEAGPDANKLTDIPAAAIISTGKGAENDWAYLTVPQKRGALRLKDSRITTPRGKGLGGTSLLNYMAYVRGLRMDFDNWANMGAVGWSYKEVFPYFLKSEDNTDPEFASSVFHSTGGLLTISSFQYKTPLMDAFHRGGQELGYDVIDINGPKQMGFSRVQGFIRNGRRCSTAKAFLIPAQDRPNLDIVNEALVTKVLINSEKVAYGVQFLKKDEHHEVRASREVIVSGGTINSAQILLLSGIGPAHHLQQMDIPVIANLPVGENYHDHTGTFFLNFEANGTKDLIRNVFGNLPTNIIDFNTDGTGKQL